jgi:hypothetical protein
MRSLLVVAVAAVALIACGGADTSRLAPLAPTRSPVATPTATPINVDDMMGLYTQQTVFVASTGKISAVTLLNHFTRYTIPTTGVAQAASDSPGQFLYVLDASGLRTFDVATGEQRAAVAGVSAPASDHSLAVAVDGRPLVLRSDARHAWVDAYEYVTLAPKGIVMEKPGCGDRLLASGSRVAIVCLATGDVAVDDLRGSGTAVLANALPKLAGATISADGAIYVVTADQHLAVSAFGIPKLVPIPWPSEWSGTVVADGIAAASGAPSVAIAEQSTDGAWLRIFQTNNIGQRLSVRLGGVPQGGIVALYPFAYYSVGSTIRHADMTSGLLETMVDVGPNARPIAVVNR